jgi:spermidine/putrescine-binding protein
VGRVKMEWYNIVSIIVGALGGVGGMVSIYQAKSKKDTIDISNFHCLIEEERKEREILKEEYKEYKIAVNEKVESVKRSFEELKQENQKMVTAILQAYRCKLPERIKDCPVIRAFNEKNECIDCNEK